MRDTGLTSEEIEAAARRGYETIRRCFDPEWDDIPDTAREASEKFPRLRAGAHNYREIIELYSRNYYRDCVRNYAGWIVPPGHRVVPTPTERAPG